jgi:predicted transcriptional regulator
MGMVTWEKLLLDPAHHAVLRNLDQPREKSHMSEKIGVEEARLQKILQNLREEGLVQQEVEEGTRKFSRNLSDREEKLKEKLEADTIGGVKEAVEKEEYLEALQHISQPPLEGDVRENAARLEAADKLNQMS